MDCQPFHHRIANVTASACLLMSCAHQPVSEPSPLVLSSCSLPDLNEHVLCGGLSVFENREARAGRRILLRIAVLPARDTASRTDPIFIIVGGPGQSAVDNAASYAALFAPLRAERAMVFVDQRGTGGSNPLPCDLYSSHPSGPLGDFLPLDAVKACRTVREQ